MRARYYDPETGRFISQDDVSYLASEHLSGLNLYAYCGNNPITYRDDSGNTWYDTLWKSITTTVGAGLGFLVGGILGSLIGAQLGYSVGANTTSFGANMLQELKSYGSNLINDFNQKVFQPIKNFTTKLFSDTIPDFLVDKVWNGVLKQASENDVVNGVLAIGGLVIAIAGAIVSTPALVALGIVFSAASAILWIRTQFD